jgi:Spy/CpxP family protein refolding chaperone
MKSTRILNVILSGAMLVPIAALAQTANTTPNSGDTNNTTTSTAPRDHERGERGEKLAKKLNLTPEQQSELKSMRENMRQQAQAIKNDSSLTADQKKAKFKELRQSSHEQMMAKLTPEQQAKFKEMQKEHRGRHGRKNKDADKTQG